MEADMSRTIWYADGLRWIGSIFNDAAEHLERISTETALLDPRALREADQYVNDVRTRAHLQF